MPTNPLLLALMTCAGFYFGKLWLDDRRDAGAGRPNPRALPGAAPAPALAVIVAVVGTLVLLAAETAGEKALGLEAKQSKMTALLGLYTLSAAVIEEIVFRGWLVLGEKHRRPAVWAGALAASLLFASLHPFLWHWDDKGFALTLDAKGWFSSGAVFATSLWLYAMRLSTRLNPQRSLLPCIAGHAAKNLGVFAIKYAQGFVTGIF